MGAIKHNIPNFITCLNLVCGCIGIVLIMRQEYLWSVYLILLAALFDFLDGLIARLLNVTSQIGKDLDSLADIISFGVLPGLMMFTMIDRFTFLSSGIPVPVSVNEQKDWLRYLAILIPVFSAIRLSIFNNSTNQNYSFKGLPTPANGLYIAGIFYTIISFSETFTKLLVKTEVPTTISLYANHFFLAANTIILSILLVSKIPLMAFKFKGFGWKENQWKYILLILCLPLIIWLKFASAPIILVLYIIISQIHFRTKQHEI